MRIILLTSLFLLCCFNKAYNQDLSFEIDQMSLRADSIYYNCDSYTTLAQLKDGLTLYTQVLSSIDDHESIYYNTILAKKYATKAAYFEYNQQYDSSIVYSNKSINLQNSFKKQNHYLKGHSYRRYYKQWWKLGEIDSMIVYAKKTDQTFTDTLGINHKLIAEALFNMGDAYREKGDHKKNIEYYKKAIAMNIAHGGEFTYEAAYQEHKLALEYGYIGFYKKELECYKNVIRRWEAMKDKKDMSYLSIAYGSLCTWYLQHGDIQTAEQYLLKQETLVKTRKTELKYWYNETFKGRTQLYIWYNRADIALHKKDTLTATLYINKRLDFIANFDENDKSNNPHNLSYFKDFVNLAYMGALRQKASILKSSNPNEAYLLNEKIINLWGEDKGATLTLPERLNVLDYQIEAGDFPEMRKKLEDYRTSAKEKKSDYVLMLLSAKNADALIAENHRLDHIDVLYKDIFKKLQRDTLKPIPIQSLKSIDCKPYGDGRIVEMILGASKNYSKAYKKTNVVESINKAHNLSTLASSVFSENFSYLPYNERTYETAIEIKEQLLNSALLLKENVDLNDVLENIELTESKLSWKKFLASNQRAFLNIPDTIIEQENDLKSELYFYKKELFTNDKNDEEKVKRFKESIYDVESKIVELEEWYQNNYPSYYKQTQKTFNLKELTQQLKKDQRIIKYVVAEKKIYAFSVTNENVTLFELGSKEVLERKVASIIKGLNDPSEQGYKNLAQDLWMHLLPEDLLGKAKRQELVFIQDDILNFLPMEVLLSPKGKHLIEAHAVSYAPSLLLWNEQVKVKKSRKNKLGIFAPTYKDFYKENPKRNDSTALLGAFSEAMQIAKLFKSDIYSGSEANKEMFINKADEYSILHLAMHSTLNNTDLEFSSLNFSPDISDSKLYISELYNISLNADLAVLSACNTGAGVLRKGEGLVNVSKAFTYAGVPSLVTSLWSVPDKETAEIMVSFYSYLKEGMSKNEALQKAKLDFLNNEDENLKHPYYWAGFIVTGDISPIVPPLPYITYVILGPLFLILGMCFFRIKRKQYT